MAQDKYRHAEDEYFKLRGQFDTGRITQESFDEKLRELMVQDAQGRYWMLGADSGKWYYYDGAKWVQSDPYPGATPPPLPDAPAATTTAAPATVPPASESAPLVAPPMPIHTGATQAQRAIPWAPILLVLTLVILGIAAFLVYQNRERLFVVQPPPQITPILPPTITRAPSPTALAALPTAEQPTLAPLATAVPPPTVLTETPIVLATSEPTNAPATNAPAITLVVITTEPAATIELPTLLPSATTPPTVEPTLAPTQVFATATHVPPTATSLPTCPNGVCVTKIEYFPDAPKRNQNVTFTATFLNSTGNAVTYNWLILLYDPQKTGNNKGFGESPATEISIPPGESKYTVAYVAVNGPGGCKNLYMHAGWKVNAFDKPLFPDINGEPVTVYFDVCP